MLCFFLLVGLLAGTAKGRGQEIVTTEPPSSYICQDRREHESYATFSEACGSRNVTYNPSVSDNNSLTFEDAIIKIKSYDISLVTPVTDLDRQCATALQQLLCFMFFPHCQPGIYVAPCYDNCVKLKAACRSFITDLLTAVGRVTEPPDLSCARLQQHDSSSDVKICAEISIPKIAQVPVDDTPSCTNRTTDPNYDEYNSTCGHLRGTNAHFTFNPPHYDPDLTFAAAVEEQRRYLALSPPVDACENPLKTKCYYVLKQLLCLFFFPYCDKDHYSSPCFDSCIEAKEMCEPVLPQLGIPGWPQRLECSNLTYGNSTTDDTRLHVCAPVPTIELSCTTTLTPTTTIPFVVSSTITSSTTIRSAAMTTSTATTTSVMAPRQTPTNYLCDSDALVTCAKVRPSVSKSAFKSNKHYKFAIRGTLIETIALTTVAHGTEIGYRVRVEQDFDLSCTGRQYGRNEIVVVHSDQSCISCIDLQMGGDYLLMGTISSSRISYHSNGDKDDGWILEATPGSGGCVASTWATKYDDRICSWLPSRPCGTRVCT